MEGTDMGYENEMKIEFDSRSCNEGFIRVAVSAFMTQLNPTLEEVADVKTAVSEAVTNCIVHAYDGKVEKITVSCHIEGNALCLSVKDTGCGIPDIEKAMEPLFTTRPEMERSGMGFAFMEAFMDEVHVESTPGTWNHGFHAKGDRMEQTLALIERSHKGDKDARNILAQQNMGLVYTVARRFNGRGCEMEDLIQIGSIGLLKAIDKFDLSYDVRFSTYAVPMIAGEIKRFLRDDGMIKVSRSLKEMAVKVCMTREKLEKDYGREPTLEEVSEEIGATREEIVMAMESASEVESLHKTIYQGDGNAISLMDGIKEEKDASEELLDHMLLNSLLGTLEEKERDLLRLRYFEDLTQVQVAKQLDMTQVQVSRMEKKILGKLRERL